MEMRNEKEEKGEGGKFISTVIVSKKEANKVMQHVIWRSEQEGEEIFTPELRGG